MIHLKKCRLEWLPISHTPICSLSCICIIACMGGPQVEEIHLLGSPGSNSSEGENGGGGCVRHLEFNIFVSATALGLWVPTWSSVFSVWIKKIKEFNFFLLKIFTYTISKYQMINLTVFNVDDNIFISDTWLIFVQLFLEYHFLNATKSCFEIYNNSLW